MHGFALDTDLDDSPAKQSAHGLGRENRAQPGSKRHNTTTGPVSSIAAPPQPLKAKNGSHSHQQQEIGQKPQQQNTWCVSLAPHGAVHSNAGTPQLNIAGGTAAGAADHLDQKSSADAAGPPLAQLEASVQASSAASPNAQQAVQQQPRQASSESPADVDSTQQQQQQREQAAQVASVADNAAYQDDSPNRRGSTQLGLQDPVGSKQSFSQLDSLIMDHCSRHAASPILTTQASGAAGQAASSALATGFAGIAAGLAASNEAGKAASKVLKQAKLSFAGPLQPVSQAPPATGHLQQPQQPEDAPVAIGAAASTGTAAVTHAAAANANTKKTAHPASNAAEQRDLFGGVVPAAKRRRKQNKQPAADADRGAATGTTDSAQWAAAMTAQATALAGVGPDATHAPESRSKGWQRGTNRGRSSSRGRGGRGGCHQAAAIAEQQHHDPFAAATVAASGAAAGKPAAQGAACTAGAEALGSNSSVSDRSAVADGSAADTKAQQNTTEGVTLIVHSPAEAVAAAASRFKQLFAGTKAAAAIAKPPARGRGQNVSNAPAAAAAGSVDKRADADGRGEAAAAEAAAPDAALAQGQQRVKRKRLQTAKQSPGASAAAAAAVATTGKAGIQAADGSSSESRSAHLQQQEQGMDAMSLTVLSSSESGEDEQYLAAGQCKAASRCGRRANQSSRRGASRGTRRQQQEADNAAVSVRNTTVQPTARTCRKGNAAAATVAAAAKQAASQHHQPMDVCELLDLCSSPDQPAAPVPWATSKRKEKQFGAAAADNKGKDARNGSVTAQKPLLANYCEVVLCPEPGGGALSGVDAKGSTATAAADATETATAISNAGKMPDIFMTKAQRKAKRASELQQQREEQLAQQHRQQEAADAARAQQQQRHNLTPHPFFVKPAVQAGEGRKQGAAAGGTGAVAGSRFSSSVPPLAPIHITQNSSSDICVAEQCAREAATPEASTAMQQDQPPGVLIAAQRPCINLRNLHNKPPSSNSHRTMQLQPAAGAVQCFSCPAANAAAEDCRGWAIALPGYSTTAGTSRGVAANHGATAGAEGTAAATAMPETAAAATNHAANIHPVLHEYAQLLHQQAATAAYVAAGADTTLLDIISVFELVSQLQQQVAQLQQRAAANAARAGVGDDFIAAALGQGVPAAASTGRHQGECAKAAQGTVEFGVGTNALEAAAANCSVQGSISNSMLWSAKYAPAAAGDMCSNTEAVGTAKQFLQDWRNLIRQHAAADAAAGDGGQQQQGEGLAAAESENDSSWFQSARTDGASSWTDGHEGPGRCTCLAVCGPCGSGKTSAVYAVAQELGFRVIEVNPTVERTAGQVLRMVGEATRSRRLNAAVHQQQQQQHSDGGGKALQANRKAAAATDTDKQQQQRRRKIAALERDNGDAAATNRHGKSRGRIARTRDPKQQQRSVGGVADHAAAAAAAGGSDTVSDEFLPCKRRATAKTEAHFLKALPLPSAGNAVAACGADAQQCALQQDGQTVAAPAAAAGDQPAAAAEALTLVLFDEVDTLLDADRGFLAALPGLIRDSRRPILLCFNSAQLPAALSGPQGLAMQHVTFLQPSEAELLRLLVLVVAAEDRRELSLLQVQEIMYQQGRDVRACLAALQFWSTPTSQKHLQQQQQQQVKLNVEEGGAIQLQQLTETQANRQTHQQVQQFQQQGPGTLYVPAWGRLERQQQTQVWVAAAEEVAFAAGAMTANITQQQQQQDQGQPHQTDGYRQQQQQASSTGRAAAQTLQAASLARQQQHAAVYQQQQSLLQQHLTIAWQQRQQQLTRVKKLKKGLGSAGAAGVGWDSGWDTSLTSYASTPAASSDDEALPTGQLGVGRGAPAVEQPDYALDLPLQAALADADKAPMHNGEKGGKKGKQSRGKANDNRSRLRTHSGQEPAGAAAAAIAAAAAARQWRQAAAAAKAWSQERVVLEVQVCEAAGLIAGQLVQVQLTVQQQQQQQDAPVTPPNQPPQKVDSGAAAADMVDDIQVATPSSPQQIATRADAVQYAMGTDNKQPQLGNTGMPEAAIVAGGTPATSAEAADCFPALKGSQPVAESAVAATPIGSCLLPEGAAAAAMAGGQEQQLTPAPQVTEAEAAGTPARTFPGPAAVAVGVVPPIPSGAAEAQLLRQLLLQVPQVPAVSRNKVTRGAAAAVEGSQRAASELAAQQSAALAQGALGSASQLSVATSDASEAAVLARVAAAAFRLSDIDLLTAPQDVCVPVSGPCSRVYQTSSIMHKYPNPACNALVLAGTLDWRLQQEQQQQQRVQGYAANSSSSSSENVLLAAWAAGLAVRGGDGESLAAALDRVDEQLGLGLCEPEPSADGNTVGATVAQAAGQVLLQKLLMFARFANSSIAAQSIARQQEQTAAVMHTDTAVAIAVAAAHDNASRRSSAGDSGNSSNLVNVSWYSSYSAAARLSTLSSLANVLLLAGPAPYCIGCGAAAAADRLAALSAICKAEAVRQMQMASAAAAGTGRLARRAPVFEHYLARAVPGLAPHVGLINMLAWLYVSTLQSRT